MIMVNFLSHVAVIDHEHGRNSGGLDGRVPSGEQSQVLSTQ
jgi:hypothetical protein